MNDEIKHKIAFYKACYYLCGLSHDAIFFYHDKKIKITETLDAYVYRYLGYGDDFAALPDAYFSIQFAHGEKKIWGTLIKTGFRKSEKFRDYFWQDCSQELPQVLSILKTLKPSNIRFAEKQIPQISIEEQNAVIEKSQEMLNESITLAKGYSKKAMKVKRLIK